jgi:hypothetical protein
METLALLGTTLGLGLTAGINLYATVFATGLALRLGWLVAPPGLEGLEGLTHPAVLVVAGVLYTVEFLADKVPAVDHAWDLVHSFVRPLGAALIAWMSVDGAQISNTPEMLIALMAGGVALTSHVTKAGGRLILGATGGHAIGAGAVVSVVEDIVAVGLTAMAIAHPLIMASIVLVFLVAFVALAPSLIRLFTGQVLTVRYLWVHKVVQRNISGLSRASMSAKVCRVVEEVGPLDGAARVLLPVRVTGMRGVPRWSSGVVDLGPSGLRFVGAGWFKIRTCTLSWNKGQAELIQGLRGFVLLVDLPEGRAVLKFYPLTATMADRVRALFPSDSAIPVGGVAPA